MDEVRMVDDEEAEDEEEGSLLKSDEAPRTGRADLAPTTRRAEAEAPLVAVPRHICV